MSTQTEAMKLALEALEETVYWRTTGIGRPPEQTAMDAITALREALSEQPAQQEPVAKDNSNYRFDPPGLDPLYTFKTTSEPMFGFFDTKPNHNVTFHNQDGKQVGALDFNGPEMVFTGDADESAKVFFDLIARSFKARLEQERADERNSWPAEMEAMERQVNILTDALAEEREKWMERTAILIRGEREACAKVCDDLALPPDVARSDASIWEVATLDCAEAIRNRSNT